MNSDEYANLERVEGRHWYYVGKRRAVRDWILRTQPPRASDRLLDCGAGTGRFAAEMAAHCEAHVLDDHAEALALLHQRFPAERVHTLHDGRIPMADASVQYLTALDVLEHIRDDAAALQEMARVLAPGGLCVVTVPADMRLWSDWDEVLHHERRYDRAQLLRLFGDRGTWDVLHVNYTNVFAYPAVWLLRRLRQWFPARAGSARAEDQVPAAPVNALLEATFHRSAMWRLPMPFGVSLLLVARRRA